MGAHLVRWTLNAGKEAPVLCKSDVGNVDLLRTMPLPDSAANAGTPMPKNMLDHEGWSLEQITHKIDRVKNLASRLELRN